MAIPLFLSSIISHARSGQSVDTLEPVTINGSIQWLLERGADSALPVLLFVHGGPGFTTMPFARAFDGDLIKQFVVVHWDQRGAGKSFDAKADLRSFNLEQFVEDGLNVTRYLQSKFGRKKVFLVGHSWGTIVATHMVMRDPSLFVAYVGVGNVADSEAADKIKLQFVKTRAKEKNDQDALRVLEKIGPPPYHSANNMMLFSNLVMKFGGIFHKLTSQELEGVIQGGKEYTSADLEKQEESVIFSIDHLAGVVNAYSAFKEVRKLEVPVTLLQGKFDMATPTQLARSFYTSLYAAKGKEWVEFSDSSHFPMWEEPRKFQQVMTDLKNRAKR